MFNTGKKVRWCSSDDSIATVNPDYGVVIAQKVGTVTITATAEDRNIVTATYVIEIEPPVPMQSLTVLNPEITLKPGETATIQLQKAPANATNPRVKWSSSDETIAKINSDGIVTAKNRERQR